MHYFFRLCRRCLSALATLLGIGQGPISLPIALECTVQVSRRDHGIQTLDEPDLGGLEIPRYEIYVQVAF